MTDKRCFELYRIIGGKPYLATMKFVQPFLDTVVDAALNGEIGKLVVTRRSNDYKWAEWHITKAESIRIQQAFFEHLKWTSPLATKFGEKFDKTWSEVTGEVYSEGDDGADGPSYRYYSPMRWVVNSLRHALTDLANGKDSSVLAFRERTGSDLDVEKVKNLLITK